MARNEADGEKSYAVPFCASIQDELVTELCPSTSTTSETLN